MLPRLRRAGRPGRGARGREPPRRAGPCWSNRVSAAYLAWLRADWAPSVDRGVGFDAVRRRSPSSGAQYTGTWRVPTDHCGFARPPRRPRRRQRSYLPAARRWKRVRFSIFLCFFLRMRLRRFLISDPMARRTLLGRPRGVHKSAISAQSLGDALHAQGLARTAAHGVAADSRAPRC